MEEINIFLKKLEQNSFKSSDIPVIIKKLHQDAKSGNVKVTKDDVQWFQNYNFALQQLELVEGSASSSVHVGDWREVIEDFSKLKGMIDEMAEKDVISNVSWSAGGMAIFDIPDTQCYRGHVYCLLRNHIEKIYGL
ncbi:hypothetical protein V7O66_09825 [Methanolobus sp. ZRKC3]|uniref:hypothetical protein n=1 Tax=Methanolobus sp. ZRKC3 TaxID=3125786 RepID=UPI00325236E1